jgi:ABC-2 type transport system permease protein
MSWERVLALAHKEWQEVMRDPVYLALAFVMPTLLMLVFGYGISQDVRKIPLRVVDHDRTAASRAYVDRFAHSEYFDFRGYAADARTAFALFSEQSARVLVVVPEDFAARLGSGRRVAVQTFIDGSFTTTRPPRTVEGYIDALHAAATAELQAGYLMRRLGVGATQALALLRPIELETRYLYNPELISIWSVAPSLIMFVLIFVGPMLMSLSVVREKECGSILNIYASTVRRSEFLAGKLLPNVVISLVNAVVLWLIAVVHFGAPFKGSLGCFALGTVLYVLCVSGLGLVVSLLVQSQQAALIIVGVTASILGMQYSGMFTPVASLAGFPWLFAHSFPPMYYLEVVTGTFLVGMGFRGLWTSLLPLVGFAALYLATALWLFRKRTSA